MSVQAPPQPALTKPKPQDTAERRQVTVMFSDLVGSTALSARMDPEDLREVISAYQKCVAETVRHFGGFVAKYMGDGVLVYFGYPQAHEDDAERAVRAGLELIAAVSGLKAASPLQTRVGIATGLVVVGDLIGSGDAQERGIVGETPNLAARLQGIAEPNTVVIAESTRKLLGSLFELQDLGPKELKGIAEPVRAWAALRASSVESRFEALRTATTPLVGREEEIELLMRRWAQAKAGDGCVVLISGEPGIGKSRHRRDTAGAPWRGAAYPSALLLLALSSGQRTLSGYRTARARGGLSPRRHAGATACQAGGSAGAGDQRSQRGRTANRGLAVDPDWRAISGAQPHATEAKGEDAPGTRSSGRGFGGAAACPDDLRGRTLERPEYARIARPAHRAGTRPCGSW